MPNSAPQNSGPDSQKPIVSKEQKLSMLLQKVTDNDLTLNEQQIDQIILQRAQVNDYIHKERMQKHDRFKILSSERKIYFCSGLVFVLILGGAILFLKPDLLEKFFLVIISIFSGFGIKEMFKISNDS